MKIISQRKRQLAGLLLASGALVLLPSCAGKRATVVTTETVTIDERTVAPAPAMIDISIINLHDAPSADPARERVVGTIVNEGDRPVSSLAIRVNALDRAGNVLHSITTPPLAETIDPFGGRARFEALMPRDPAVAGYHAVAIAR